MTVGFEEISIATLSDFHRSSVKASPLSSAGGCDHTHIMIQNQLNVSFKLKLLIFETKVMDQM